jgi:polyhydroxyalkanoate synthesis regulator phasin
MAKSDGWKRYVEAGALLGQVTRARAEEIVRELVSTGDVQREQAQRWVDELVERSRRTSEDLVNLIRSEVAAQLTALGLDPDELAHQAAELLRHSADVGRAAAASAAERLSARGTGVRQRATRTVAAARRARAGAPSPAGGARSATKKAAGTKAATKTKKAAGTKAAVTKAATKKAAGTKAAVKKAATKKAGPAKAAPRRAAGTSGSSGSGT